MHQDFGKLSILCDEALEKLAVLPVSSTQQKLLHSYQDDFAKQRVSDHKVLEVYKVLCSFSLKLEARDMIGAAHGLIPSSFAILKQYVACLCELKEEQAAELVLQAHMDRLGTDWCVVQLLGRVLFRQGKTDEQLALIETFLHRQPDHLDALIERASLKSRHHDIDEEEAIEAILKHDPDNLVGLSQMVIYQCGQHGAGEIEMLLARLNKIHPEASLSAFCSGVFSQKQGRYRDALSYFEEAIHRDPRNLNAYGKAGKIMLHLGMDLKRAWQRLESRFPTLVGRPEGEIWQGQDLKYKKLFIWAEQGIADQVEFSSMLRDLPNNINEVNVECDAKLVNLMQGSFPHFHFHPRDGKRNFHFDFHIPIGGLARYLRTTYDSFTFSPVRYLMPKREAVSKWLEWLNSLGAGKKVGISWQSPGHAPKRVSNSLDLVEDYRDILTLEGVSFISLYYGDAQDMVAKVQDELGITIHVPPGLDQFNDLDETAGLISALDACFGISTAPIVLAKALGVETFVIGYADCVAPLWWPDAHYIKPDESEKIRDYLTGS